MPERKHTEAEVDASSLFITQSSLVFGYLVNFTDAAGMLVVNYRYAHARGGVIVI